MRKNQDLTPIGGSRPSHATAKPRIVHSPDRQPARGRFTLDPASGQVSASELELRTGDTTMTFKVTYAQDPSTAAWVPWRMEERHITRRAGTVEGTARYTNDRRFRVEASLQ